MGHTWRAFEVAIALVAPEQIPSSWTGRLNCGRRAVMTGATDRNTVILWPRFTVSARVAIRTRAGIAVLADTFALTIVLAWIRITYLLFAGIPLEADRACTVEFGHTRP